MPLPKRLVEPVHVARGTIPDNFPLPSELEAATNGTLANTVRQLSSLSKHAEDLFGELAREAHGLFDRANSLQARIDRLAVKVTQLDSNVEEGSLPDYFDRILICRWTCYNLLLKPFYSFVTRHPHEESFQEFRGIRSTSRLQRHYAYCDDGHLSTVR